MRYNILCDEKIIHEGLTEEEYFDKMEDLAVDFYLSGSPAPERISTQTLED